MFRKILIADDHFVVRSGTAMALQAFDSSIEVAFAESYHEIAKLLDTASFELMFLDINMPGVDKSVVKEIKRKCSDIKIIIFSAYTGSIVHQFIREGAEGYFFPLELTVEMLSLPQLVNPKKFLSEREYEIYELFAKGLGNLEITNSLSIQPGTVSTYKKRIFKKLNVSSIAEMVKIHMNFKDL